MMENMRFDSRSKMDVEAFLERKSVFMPSHRLRTQAVLVLAFTAICLLALVSPLFAQTWRGGNTANYNANTICADRYLVHRPGTTWPSDSFDVCCPETLGGFMGGVWIYDTTTTIIGTDTIISIDSVLVPVRLGVDTLFFGSETLVVSDTIFYIGTDGLGFFRNTVWVCDSVLLGIDTLTSDTLWCKFCDSVATITWFTVTGDDTSAYDVWRVNVPPVNDSCGAFRGFGTPSGDDIHITYTVIDSSVTNIVSNYEYGGFWLDYDGDTVFISNGDTVHIAASGTVTAAGIWARDCACDTIDTLVATDSLNAFLCIDTTWQVYWASYRVTNSPEYWKASVETSRLYNHSFPLAKGVNIYDHDSYCAEVIDSFRALVHDTDSLTTALGRVPAWEAFYCGFDSTADYGVFTRVIDSAGVDTMTCASIDFEQGNDVGDVYGYAMTLRYSKMLDFSDIPDFDVATLNATQPRWVAWTMRDDVVPAVWFNGVAADLDTNCLYEPKVHYFQPPPIDYSTPFKIETGVHSTNPSYIGAQVVFGLAFDTVIVADCWTLRDSIVLPDCPAFSPCADSICVRFPQGWHPGFEVVSYYDTVVCFSICELETVQMGGYAPLHWTPTLSISSDSTDTASITNYQDSLVIASDDAKPLVSAVPVETRQGLTIALGDSLKFTNGVNKQNMNMFTSGDTVFLKAKSDTTIVAIGSGTWYISGTAQWVGSCAATGEYSMAVGFEDTVSGDQSVAIGYRNTVTGNGSFSIGGIGNRASANYDCVLGGEGNRVTANSSAILGGYNGIVTAENSVLVCSAGDSIGTSDGGSRFMSGADSSYFEGSTVFGGGTAIKKVVKVGSHLAIITSADDTLWAASDTTGF